MQPSNLCLPGIGNSFLLLAMSITAFGLVGTAYAQAVLTAAGRYVIVVTQEVPNVLRAGEALQLEKCVPIERIRDGTAFRARYPYPLSACPVAETNFRWRVSDLPHRLRRWIARRGKVCRHA